MKIYFINSKQKECGVYQYGRRLWDSLKDSTLNIQYFEISDAKEFLLLDFTDVSILFFNWIEGGTAGPFGWYTHDLAQQIKQQNITTVSIMHTNSCFSAKFDYFIDQNPYISGMPRPLYKFDAVSSNHKNKVINIGSFGFVSNYKKFDTVVKLVNEQFDIARINLNISTPFYAHDSRNNLERTINEIRAIPLKPGIELNLNVQFLDNDELLDFISKNDLMIFAYENMEDVSSVVDYVVSTETPLGVTSTGAFKHVYTEKIDIHKHKLQDILDFNKQTKYIAQYKKEWSTDNIKRFFEIAFGKIGQTTYAQACQDRFALELVGPYGFFLDLGAGWDEFAINSNTLLLEEHGWDGICVDGDSAHAERRQSKSIRSKIICTYVPQTTIKEILDSNNAPKIIDYVSIDIDPVSVEALLNFPFNDYEFKVMTFEHDLYRAGSTQKDAAYNILTKNGYVRLCNNVNVPESMGLGLYFEDWWVNPKYFSQEFIENNTFDGQLGTHITSNIRI
jgi:hypothetical protein